MSNDIAQTNLKEPAQVDWDALGGSKWVAPPPAVGADGKPIVYYGVAPVITEDKPDEDNLNFLIDPIKIVKSGTADGYVIRFTRASTKVLTDYTTKLPKKGNPNKLAQFIRSAGAQQKPATNADYRAIVKSVQGKPFAFTTDWEAYNKDTQESVKGFLNFPLDPERPGQRKAILKQGEVLALVDPKTGVPTGETYVVKSEVLFANLKLKYFRDPTKGSV
jgi:hypothetical protein